MDIKEKDIIELDNSGNFYQCEILNSLFIEGDDVIDKPTLVYDYEDCADSWYSYMYEVNNVLDRITAIYRKEEGILKLIYKR